MNIINNIGFKGNLINLNFRILFLEKLLSFNFYYNISILILFRLQKDKTY